MTSGSASPREASRRRVRALSILVGVLAVVGAVLDVLPLELSVLGGLVAAVGLLWGAIAETIRERR